MGHLGLNLSRNGLIVLISVIFVAGAGTAYAGIVLPTITLAGNTHTTGNAVIDGNLNVGDSMTVTTASSIQGLSVANSFGFNAKGVSSSVTSPTGLTFGVFGQSFSPSGTGVRGDVINPSGETYGVYGSVNSPEGFGLFTPDNAHVGGDLSVSGEYTYFSPKTRSVVIFPVEFASTFDVDWTVPLRGAAGVIESTSAKRFLFASIPQLPDGATITRLDCRVLDNDGSQSLGCAIIRKSFLSDSGEDIADVNTSGASGSLQTISDTSIKPGTEVVDRDTFGYIVRYIVSDPACDDSCKLFSAKVTYTIDRVE